jgi:hypothetical protein
METIAARSVNEAVLLIHGIRDFAEWQHIVSSVLAEIPNINICPLKYGRFDAFRFWFPIWTREVPIKKLLWRIRAAQEKFPAVKLSVIAHSFGTYAIANILKENPDIRLHRLILCGAIVPSEFRWDQIQHRVETEIINDCGISDVWPVLAQSTTFGYGASGRFGFGTPGVRDRYHDFGHGGFFEKDFVRDFWLPWFRNGELVDSKVPPRATAPWHLLTIFQLKWVAVLACLIGILTSSQRCSDSGMRTLQNFLQLISPRWPPNEVKIGDEIFLRDRDGKYIVSLGSPSDNNWPGLAQTGKAPLKLLGNGQVRHGSLVRLQSLEHNLNQKNVLLAASPACYYETDGFDVEKQEWKIEKLNASDQVLHYGDQIYLENVYFKNHRLSEGPPFEDSNRTGGGQPETSLAIEEGALRWWKIEKK